VYEFVTLICVWVRDSFHVHDCQYSYVSTDMRRVLQHDVVCCRVLQSVAVCYSALKLKHISN